MGTKLPEPATTILLPPCPHLSQRGIQYYTAAIILCIITTDSRRRNRRRSRNIITLASKMLKRTEENLVVMTALIQHRLIEKYLHIDAAVITRSDGCGLPLKRIQLLDLIWIKRVKSFVRLKANDLIGEIIYVDKGLYCFSDLKFAGEVLVWIRRYRCSWIIWTLCRNVNLAALSRKNFISRKDLNRKSFPY